jgi:hypothetical protein
MSKTALLEAIRKLDVAAVRGLLGAAPGLKELRDEKGLDLLQMTCKRATHEDRAAAERQLGLAKWLVKAGFDPRVIHTAPPGEDGEEEAADLSLVWFAIARGQNTRLARYFLELGASPHGCFAAAWWGNGEIMGDLVRHGADINEVVGATPLHMAVDVAQRGVEGKPALARRRLKCLETMLELGADPNLPAMNRETPLHTALRKESFDAFKLLLRHGADPDLPGKDQRTVRDLAARKRDPRWRKAIESGLKPPR